MSSKGSASKHPHVLLFALAAWGHTRPLSNLASKIAKLRGVHVTLFTWASVVEKVHIEISRSFGEKEQEIRKLIRVVALPGDMDTTNFLDVDESFRPVYHQLAKGEPVTCSVKGTVFDAVLPPTVVIIDFFALRPLRTIRELSPERIPVLAWQSADPGHVLRDFGPVEYGGMGDLKPIVHRIAEEHGLRVTDATAKYFDELPGEVVTLGKLPPMYDYENFPQPMPLELLQVMAEMHHIGYHAFLECDGIVQTSDPSFARDSIEVVENWMASSSPPRKVYSIGPQLPFGTAADTRNGDLKQSSKSEEIVNFLDAALKSHGAKSVVYISFGTVWGPWAHPEQLWAMLDVFMETKVPFIMSHASPFASVPDEVLNKVTESGLGVIAHWSPQQYILSHPATGWFVTHAGMNSALESLAAGIPMICWDFAADQPMIAANLSRGLNVAYHLLEVRNGRTATKPAYRTGKAPEGSISSIKREVADVVEQMRGPDGATKRQNVERICEELAESMKEGGNAHRSLLTLFDDLGL
ncbi:UDP-Glycosyltransferase/glycogen phosphorylase [Punctularia strigosozonata HHB-11173 SS5]|uniref:UDP-Glycosyltransferase/glycogen phosphorylase n=1 Tax=Punctularia strigosozonata (strain HHB-11173) TaxID=741275 RepID=UPI0004416936|nr:UDP-Glycosyltransferase/glycogen phosphorylase [Punctularia strigosozonata HHB-11173 SS5]EIN06253.1 UDP-Glycosyltransferase/glycogen phosphorylase [Punctularia strigosozonata HHB-11173 SS5]